MPVAVPNSFYQRYNKYNNIRCNNSNNYRVADNFYSNEIDNLIEENQSKSFYLVRLEQKIKRLENINNIFLDILREKTDLNKNMYRNKSSNDVIYGSYPYLSFDKNKNKELLYLNSESINNNRLLDPNYRHKYLLPLLPKYNSVSENNRMNYLLNNEKLKHFSEGSTPYFFYNNKLDKNNIPQKINSVQYFNKKIDIKKFTNSTKKINDESNDEKKSKAKSSIIKTSKTSSKLVNNTDIRNEINKLNDSLNKRLSKIENLQKTQKKDIDFLLNKSKGNNKSETKSNKDSIKKESNKENNNNIVNKKENNDNDKNNKDNNTKKEESKKGKTDESEDDDEDEEEEDDDEDDDDEDEK